MRLNCFPRFSPRRLRFLIRLHQCEWPNSSRGETSLSFFKRLIPIKAKVWLSLDKPNFAEGEPVVGKVNIEAKEYLQAQEVRVEARVFENFEVPVWVQIGNQRVQRMERQQTTLFSRDVRVSGPTDFGSGPARSFPFSVAISTYRPTRAGGTIENSVKGVVSVHGRPDVTGSTQIAFGPPSAYPSMMPQMQPGYGPNPAYGPRPGYGSAPGYGPAPAPGYGPQPMNPGWGAPAPGYNMPPQPPLVTQQVVKVRCKYCQTLIDTTSANCPNCGGRQ